MRLLAPVDDINQLLDRTRVLLVPSLWAEARSRIILEAMLRGVPVMAADVGGIPEAMMGVPYLLPVRPIEKYETRLDEQMVPVARSRSRISALGESARSRLLTDREHYEAIARQSRAAALEYARQLHAGHFEEILKAALARDKRANPSRQREASDRSGDRRSLPEKRKLLALRLRKQAAAASWFPGVDAAAARRLFCFPHAGGGAAAGPVDGLPDWGTVRVRLPGRESRLAEAPFERMAPLVTALADAIDSYSIARSPSSATPWAPWWPSNSRANCAAAVRRCRQPDRVRRPRAAVPARSRAACSAFACGFRRGTSAAARHPRRSARRSRADARHSARA